MGFFFFISNQFELISDAVCISIVMFLHQNLFMAEVYTGAVTLIWAMAELARNPEIMKNAQEEV
ncbi:cytochrome P450, putative [Ricinus communis]|uniref:Cytochrome P450, putative n=1 Tax=Ricinus communis TaxID=3988 RepID=B9SJ84_RICCO|nr:cytochrome P450, putative [Ricinus communis]